MTIPSRLNVAAISAQPGVHQSMEKVERGTRIESGKGEACAMDYSHCFEQAQNAIQQPFHTWLDTRKEMRSHESQL